MITVATVRQVQDLWVDHQGWGKWGSSPKRRFDAIVLQRNAKKFPAPIGFWKALFACIPLGAAAVYIEGGHPPMIEQVWQKERKVWERDGDPSMWTSDQHERGFRRIADILLQNDTAKLLPSPK